MTATSYDRNWRYGIVPVLPKDWQFRREDVMRLRFIVGTLAVGIVTVGPGMAYSQDYPQKSIRIVTSAAGGGSDFVARLLAKGFTDSMGQQVVVENRPAGPMSGEIVSRAPPDGYTLLVGTSSVWTGAMFQKTSYDTVHDFSPIALMSRVPNILVVHPALPVNSVKDLIALAKARPGELNYASGATGGGSHLGVELFKYMAGVNIVRITYKGGFQQLTDLISGRVQLTIDSPPTLMPTVKSGKLKALAITSAQPSPLYPDLRTVAASGLPGYEAGQVQGIWAPAKTPEAIIKRLNEEVLRFLKTTQAQEKFIVLGYEIVGSSPQQFATVIKADIARTDQLIKSSGIKTD